jgi:hypothetical protein
MTKDIKQRITEIEYLLSDNNKFSDCVNRYKEGLQDALQLIQKFQEENKKLKQTQDNLVKDLTSCWDRQEACRVKDEKRCEELDEINKEFDKLKKENESLRKSYEITNLFWRDLYKENNELKKQLKIK